MSTPRRLKEARMEAHRQEKIEKKRKKLFTVNSDKSKRYTFNEQKSKSFRRETKEYPSFSPKELSGSSTERKEPKEYSGDYIVGIATMHKSNLVPIGRGDNPQDYATMRRS